jgi:hypothetical protein
MILMDCQMPEMDDHLTKPLVRRVLIATLERWAGHATPAAEGGCPIPS